MASPFAFAWMLLKDSARYRPEEADEEIRQQQGMEEEFTHGKDESEIDRALLDRMLSQPQHPPMPLPDEGPTLGEMADMSPEEKEFEMSMARRRNAPKPEDPAQTTLHDFGG